MKSLTLIAAVVFATATFAPAATNDLSSTLQRGLFEEEANHNLDAAIAAYQSVATQFDKNRKLAATAIFRLGEVYRKQGKTNEANAQYERIVQEFSDQTALAQLSRGYLAKTETGESTSDKADPKSSAPKVVTWEEVEIGKIKAMIKDSPDLINALRGGIAPLHTAASGGQLTVAEFLLASGADVSRKNNQNQTPLYLAAENGHRAMVELLLSKGADVNARNPALTALHKAAEQGFKVVAEVLLKAKADPNANAGGGTAPLHLAARAGHKAVAELLLENGANINAKDSEGRTPLSVAINANNLEMAKFLIERKADVNTASKENRTPLHDAILRGASMVELLLKNGANTEAKLDDKDRKGWTPLHLAVAHSPKEIVEMLLKGGSNPSSVAESGATPLHFTADGGRQDIAEMLLAHKADVNAKTVQGDTPLLWAVRNKNKPMTELFLMHKADPNLANNKQETPLGIVNAQGTAAMARPPSDDLNKWKEVGDLLAKYGADENQESRVWISVTRNGTERYTIFYKGKGTNSWNRFTLLEAFGAAYSKSVFPEAAFPFPNLAKVKIHRLEAKAKGKREIPVDMEAILKSGDCSKDIWLEWGDVIEIPEKDHKLDEQWRGFPKELLEMLPKCLARNVSISVKGETKPIALTPKVEIISSGATKGGGIESWYGPRGFDFWLNDVVSRSGLLRSSSDKTRVKVTRINPTKKKSEEQIFNLEQISHSQNNLWLRDGDVIEIPERDPNAPPAASDNSPGSSRTIPTRTLQLSYPQPAPP